jgi:hypothetical protein
MTTCDAEEGMLKYLRINYQTVLLILALFVLGALCFILTGEDFIKVFSFIAAFYLLASAAALITMAARYHESLRTGSFFDRSEGYITYASILILFAIVLIIFPEYLVRGFIGIVLILIPLFHLIQAEDKKRYFRFNFWKFIVGVIFVVAVDAIIDIILGFLGIALFIAGAVLIALLIRNYRDKECPNLISKYIAYLIKQKSKE